MTSRVLDALTIASAGTRVMSPRRSNTVSSPKRTSQRSCREPGSSRCTASTARWLGSSTRTLMSPSASTSTSKASGIENRRWLG